jgi:hypothetical protein
MIMSNRKRLTKRQRAVLDDMFDGELDEQAILAKHKLKAQKFARWLTEGPFAKQFDRRLESARRQCELILARYAPLAAGKLVQLTESKNEETARKTCLDIISNELVRSRENRETQTQREELEPPPAEPQLSDETCSKLLAVLAEQTEGE